MSIFAVVDDITNICDNVIEWNDVTPWEPPPAHYIINIDGIEAGIGWSYDPATNVWTPPPPPPEPVVTPTEAPTVI